MMHQYKYGELNVFVRCKYVKYYAHPKETRTPFVIITR